MVGWIDDPLMVMAFASLIATVVVACFVMIARKKFDFGNEENVGGL